MGASCTCKMQVQCKFRQFRGVLRKSPAPSTHGGNIGRVTADVGAITIQQLHEYTVPYDELIFGKPFADFYIDDKAVSPFVDELHKETGIIA